MTTTVNKSFQVTEPIDLVWKNISDPDTLVNCLPGGLLTEKVDDQNYKGEVAIKFGPVKTKLNGLITFEEMNEAEKKLKMLGKGEDIKGKGRAGMKMDCQLNQHEGGTQIDYTIDISISGKLATFGSRLIGEVSNVIFDQFQDNFKEHLAGQEVDNTISATKMTETVVVSFLDRIKAFFLKLIRSIIGGNKS